MCLFGCRLTPYRCLATGVNTGFIEIVQESETIANIQKLSKKKAKASKLWDSALLMQWLQERNQDPAQYVAVLFMNQIENKCEIISNAKVS